MSESLFTSAWDSFAANGQEGTWSVDVDMPPSFVVASATLSSYQQHAANAYAYCGIRSYATSTETKTFEGYNGVIGAIAESNVQRITFAHGLGCHEGPENLCVLASFILQATIWE